MGFLTKFYYLHWYVALDGVQRCLHGSVANLRPRHWGIDVGNGALGVGSCRATESPVLESFGCVMSGCSVRLVKLRDVRHVVPVWSALL